MRRGRRLTAIVCALSMIVSGIHLSQSPTNVEAKVLSNLKELGRQVAAEGCVLVENKNSVLPYKSGTTVSVFGRSQCHYDRYKSGLGSGGEVRVDGKDVIGIVEGLRRNDRINVNEDLVKIYEDWVKNNPYDYGGGGWDTHPWSQKEMPLSDEVVNNAKANSDEALIVISRTAGENRDSSFQKGGYLLTDAEEDMINKVSHAFDKVAVVLNVTAIIDMGWVDRYPVDSVVYMWNGGQNGGEAIADILTGKVTPSGHLADTIATDYTKYPTYNNYGGSTESYYQEDIYVGYRYFETFAPQDVKYPFGYGLSYTTFDINTESVNVENGNVKIRVAVENTGNTEGKQVVQVYYGAPQNKLGNPVKELVAFAKTETIQPGEIQIMELTYKLSDMASYDDSGVTGHESAYVLESGDYKIYVGDNVRSSNLVYTYYQNANTVVEQLSEAAAPIKDFTRIKAVESNGNIQKTEESVPKRSINVEQKIKNQIPAEMSKKDNNTYRLIDVYNNNITLEQFVAQMTNEEMAAIVQGSSQNGANAIVNGAAGGLGGVTCKTNGQITNLGSVYGIPVASVADGPSGVRLSDYGTLLPCGNVIGCSWNLDLVEELYELEGQEMILNGVDSLLGPGINIHRDPRCGRNFEYFSEDPLVSGRMAAAIAKGVQKVGASVTAKHYACNNAECDINLYEARRRVDAIVSERALREIYLKGFEIYVKEGHGRSLMTSYNPINGCWAPSNYDLVTQILRLEWGYEGIVMTDWWGGISKYAWADGTRDESGRYLATMVKAQNDIYIPVDNIYDGSGNLNDKGRDILDNLNSGYLTRAELQRSAYNICQFLLHSYTFSKYYNIEFKPYVSEGEDWFKVEYAEQGNPQIEDIYVGGRRVVTFNKNIREYRVYWDGNANTLPEVTATAKEGTEVTVTQATVDNNTATIRAKEDQTTKVYRVVFLNTENLDLILEDSEEATLTNLYVNGKEIEGFDAGIYEYNVAVNSLTYAPQITYNLPEGVQASYSYDAQQKKVTIRVVSKDQIRVYKLNLGIAPQSDEFDGNVLNNFWSIENENSNTWRLENGRLVINAERGSLFAGENNHKNKFVQSAYGDWEVVTKIDLSKKPNTDYESIGIIVKQDDDNYIKPKIEWSGGFEVSLTQEINGGHRNVYDLTGDELDRFSDVIYIKMTKLGNVYRAAVSTDGQNYIEFSVCVSAEYENPLFGLVCGTGGNDTSGDMTAYFDYVHFSQEVGETVTIGDDTKLKVAETDPIAISGNLTMLGCQDEDGGMCFSGTASGEYLIYQVDVQKTGYYDISARMASSGESDTQQFTYNILSDNKVIASIFANSTGGEQSWSTVPGGVAYLTKGKHKIKIAFDTKGVNLNWIRFAIRPEVKTHDAYSRIEAEDCDLIQGAIVEGTMDVDGDRQVAGTRDGYYTEYLSVDFGTVGATKAYFRGSTVSDGCTVEIRTDSPTGKLIGTMELPNTGGWDRYDTFVCDIQKTTGIHKVYLVYRGSDWILNLNWFQFEEEQQTSISIVGYQISTEIEAHRVVYSVNDPKNEVVEVGLVYGLKNRANDSDIYVGSQADSVYTFAASDKGKLSYSVGEGKNVQSYAMTMKFIKSSEYYTADIYVRAYAKLSNGDYVYSDISTSSVYKIAEKLYNDNLMSSEEKHNYLYNNILKKCNNDFVMVDYKAQNDFVLVN